MKPMSRLDRSACSGRLCIVAATLASVISLTPPAGCASSRPTLSGFAIGKTRFVRVGDVLKLRLPLRGDGGRTWRVTSYDSAYFNLIGRPEIVRTDEGGEAVIRARAKIPGETSVEVTEVLTPQERVAGERPRTVTFDVRINR